VPQEFAESIGAAITDAAVRAGNNIEQRPIEDVFAEAVAEIPVSFLAGAGMGAAMPKETLKSLGEKNRQAAKLREIAAQKAREGNAAAAQTLETAAQREEQKASNEEQAALANIQAQQQAIFDEMKAEAGSIDDRIAQAEVPKKPS
jgi:uncharacterized membrane protein YqiK